MPLVSVVIRTQGERQAALREALRSVERQTYPNLEAVLVFAGEDKDAFHAWREEIAAWEPHARPWAPEVLVEAIHASHGNRALALNDGMRNSTGDYLGFLDDDGSLRPWHVERLVNALETPAIAKVRDELVSAKKTIETEEKTFYRLPTSTPDGLPAPERAVLGEKLDQLSKEVAAKEAFLFSQHGFAFTDVGTTPRPLAAFIFQALVARKTKFETVGNPDAAYLARIQRGTKGVHVPGAGG